MVSTQAGQLQKAFVDGACAGGSCLLDEPFEGTNDHGMQVTATQDLRELVSRVAGDGVVLGVHANGDRAIRLLLDAHEPTGARDRSAAPGMFATSNVPTVNPVVWPAPTTRDWRAGLAGPSADGTHGRRRCRRPRCRSHGWCPSYAQALVHSLRTR